MADRTAAGVTDVLYTTAGSLEPGADADVSILRTNIRSHQQ